MIKSWLNGNRIGSAQSGRPAHHTHIQTLEPPLTPGAALDTKGIFRITPPDIDPSSLAPSYLGHQDCDLGLFDMRKFLLTSHHRITWDYIIKGQRHARFWRQGGLQVSRPKEVEKSRTGLMLISVEGEKSRRSCGDEATPQIKLLDPNIPKPAL